jgi:Flp pilus assembly protein TadD
MTQTLDLDDALENDAPVSIWRRASLPATLFAVWVLSASLVVYQLTRPRVLAGAGGYDDGVYFGAAIRLVQGHLPYRDFVFLHPPGLPLLLAPVALLSDLFGTHDAFAIARLVTGLVGTANAVLVGMLLRSRGPRAVLVGGAAFACFPLAVAANGTVTLEPYLLLFCLLGANVLFRRGGVAEGRGALVAGLLLGIAVSVKIWAILPVAVLLTVCAHAHRRSAVRVLAGVALGLTMTCGPFVALAPKAFIRDVLTVQILRGASASDALPVARRVLDLTGLTAFTGASGHSTAAVATFGALAALALGALLLDRPRTTPAEWFTLGSWLTMSGAVLTSKQFYAYYAYFPAAFGAVSVVAAADHLVVLARTMLSRLPRSDWTLACLRVALAPLAVVAILVVAVPRGLRYDQAYLNQMFDPTPVVDSAHVPPDACVLFDSPDLAIVSGRMTPKAAGCPPVLDTFGTWLAEDPAHPPGTGSVPSALARRWQGWLGRADYLVLSVQQSSFLPWDTELLSWFAQNYRLEGSGPGVYAYQNLHAETIGSATDLLERGLVEQEAGQASLAEKDYRAALALNPHLAAALYDLGVLAQQRGDAAAARGYYERALAEDSRFERALYNLAVLAADRPSEAESLYRRALAVDPRDAGAQLNLGLILLRQGLRSDAQQHLREAVRLNSAYEQRLPKGWSRP